MKLFNLFILLFVLGVGAQRRISTTESSSETAPHRTNARGRVRFSSTADAAEIASSIQSEVESSTERRKPTVVRKIERKQPKSPNRPYEVKEILDDVPNENAKKIHKPRVITETRFEAANAPKTPLFIPVPLPEDEILPENLLPNFKSVTTISSKEKIPETTNKNKELIDLLSVSPQKDITVSTEQISEDVSKTSEGPEITTASEQVSSTENEIKSTEPEITEPVLEIKRKLVENTPRLSLQKESSGIRSKTRARTHSEEVPTLASRQKTRTRPSRKPDSETSESATVRNQRVRSRARQEPQKDETSPKHARVKAIRRRLESAETESGIKARGPSVFSLETSQEFPSRSRTGRKANFPTNRRGRTNSRENYLQTEANIDKVTSLPAERTVDTAEENTSTESTRTNLRRRNPIQKATKSEEANSNENISRTASRNRSTGRFVEIKQDSPLREPKKSEIRERNINASQTSNGRRTVVRSRKSEPKIDTDLKVNKIEPPKTEIKDNVRQVSRRTQSKVDSTDIESAQKRSSRSRRPEANLNHEFKDVIQEPTHATSRKSQEKSKLDETTNRNPANVIRSKKPDVNVNIEQDLNKIDSSRLNGRRSPELLKTDTISVRNGHTRSRTTEAVVSIVPDLNKNVIELPKEKENASTTEKAKLDEITTSTASINISSESENKKLHNKNRSTESRRNSRTFRTNHSRESIEFLDTSTAKIPLRRRSKINEINTASSTERVDKFRNRKRIRFLPPIIDEQKLEVLPLFESEAKTVGPIFDSPAKSRRKSHKTEGIPTSTEHEISARSSNEIRESPQFIPAKQNIRLETVTSKIQESRVKKPITKESVESEISEVVSVRKVGRQNAHKELTDSSNQQIKRVTVKIDEPKVTVSEVVTSLKRSKSENKPFKKNLSLLTHSDEINESDNYPEPFKALLQGKITKSSTKGSRSQHSREDTGRKVAEKVVITPRIVSTTTTIPTKDATISGRVEDVDNELVPKSSTTANPRSTRKRFSLTTKYPESNEVTTAKPSKVPKRTNYSSRKSIRSTRAPSHESVVTEISSSVQKQTKYHAKFSSNKPEKKHVEGEHASAAGQSRLFPSKPPRGLYSSRQMPKKDVERNRSRNGKSEPSITASQISLGSKKSSRFSSRYRKNLLTLTGAIRPTKVPAYIPTLPTPSSVKSGIEDSEMEVISIDEPVNTIPSDSLINGELLTPSNPYNPSSKLFPASLVSADGASTTAQTIPTKTTEKPVSIIERIIYSITSISTTKSPNVTLDTTNVGPTKSSAIFKIPNKTSKLAEKTDVTIDQTIQKQLSTINQIQSSTTEKPTTVIEKILSSLSAIQATTSESAVSQVGSNLNSISTTSKHLPSVSASISSTVSTTFSPEVTSTLDPLVVLEQISSEQTIQERTIAKLLSLLKSIKPTTISQEHVVIVTPKTTFISTTPDTPTTDSNLDVEVFNITSNLISDRPEKQIEFSTTPTSSSISKELLKSNENEKTTLTSLNIEATTSTNPEQSSAENISDNSIIENISTESINIPSNSELTTQTSLNSDQPSSEKSEDLTTSIISSKLSELANIQSETLPSTTISSVTSTSTTFIPDSSGNEVDSFNNVDKSQSNTEESSTANISDNSIIPNISTETVPSDSDLTTQKSMNSDQPNSSEKSDEMTTFAISSKLSELVNPESETLPSTIISTSPSTTPIPDSNGNEVDSIVLGSNSDKSAASTNSAASTDATSMPKIMNSGGFETISLSDYLSSLTARTNIESTTIPQTTTTSSEYDVTSSVITTTSVVNTESISSTNAIGSNLELSNLVAEIEVTTIPSSTPKSVETSTISTISIKPSSDMLSIPETMSTVNVTENIDITVDANPVMSTESPSTVELQSRLVSTDSSTMPIEIGEKTLEITNPIEPSPTTETSSESSSVIDLQSRLVSTSTEMSTENPNITFEPAITTPTTESPNPSTSEIPLTVDQMSKLISVEKSNIPTIVSTTFKIEQTTLTTTESSENIFRTTDYSVTGTIPPLSTLSNFEVSPGSVTVFSANDVSSMFNPTDDGTTVTILSRSYFTTESDSENKTMLETTTTSDTNLVTESTIVPNNDTENEIIESSLTNSTIKDVSSTDMTNTTEVFSTSTESFISNASLADLTSENITMSNTAEPEQLQTSTEGMPSESLLQNKTTNTTQPEQLLMNQTKTNLINDTSIVTPNVPESNRSGKLLAIEPEPLQNDLQTSSVAPEKDYFIFAVLPNNTIVRKRPPRYPNKNTPFIIFGVYPNNTIVQKFPNGTLIPEEPIIQVSGFDTRENPPTLPEITSNQVTQPNQDSRPDNKNLQTADIQNTVSAVEVNELAVESSTNAPTAPTLPTLSDMLSGKTVQAINNVVNQTSGDQPTVYETLDVNPVMQTSRTDEIDDANIEDNIISNKSNVIPEKIVQSTTENNAQVPESTIATVAPTINEITSTTNSPATTTNAPTTTTNAPTTTTETTTQASTTQVSITQTSTTQASTTRMNSTPESKQTTINDSPITTPNIQTVTSPNVLNRIGELKEETTTTRLVDTTLIEPVATTTFRSIRYTNTPTTINQQFENFEFTTPFVIQRLLNEPGITNRAQTTRTRPFVTTTEPVVATQFPITTTQSPITTTRTITTTQPITTTTTMRERSTTTQPLTTETTTPITTARQRTTTTERLTTTQPTTIAQTTTEFSTPQRTEIPSTTTFVPTMTVPVATAARRGRLRITTTQEPDTTTDPPTTTYVPRRYTMTTVLPKRTRGRITTTQIPETTAFSRRYTTTPILNSEDFTIFPVYTSSFATTRRPPIESIPSTTQQTITVLPTKEELARLSDLRIEENYGEVSTTNDFSSPTTISPSISSTLNPVVLQTTLKSINSKVRLLNDQQKKDLEELQKLEREQQAILQQLAFLTRLNLGGSPKPTRSPSNLASRVLDFAADGNKGSRTNSPSPFNLLEALTGSNTKESKKVALSDKNPSVEEVLRQLNVNPNSVTVSSLSSTYGKSTDAILAALLKEQGIGPSTPKSLGDQLKTTTFVTTDQVKDTTTPKIIKTTRRRATTTPRPGPLMQGLNWLLNVLDPSTTTKRPATQRPKTTTTTRRSVTIPSDVEILSSQPTEISPVIVTAPPRSTTVRLRTSNQRQKRPLHSLSEQELQSLITQLESVQRDPSKAKSLDLSSLNIIQSTPKPTTIIEKNVVQITNSGNVGTSSKLQTPIAEILSEATEAIPTVYNRIRSTKANRVRSTSARSVAVSNSIVEEEFEETTPPPRRTTLPPVRLDPVHGVDDTEGPQVRGQLINAAVNVTKAISQFLGSAIQGAASRFQSFIGSGSRQVGNYFSGSSSSNRPG